MCFCSVDNWCVTSVTSLIRLTLTEHWLWQSLWSNSVPTTPLQNRYYSLTISLLRWGNRSTKVNKNASRKFQEQCNNKWPGLSFQTCAVIAHHHHSVLTRWYTSSFFRMEICNFCGSCDPDHLLFLSFFPLPCEFYSQALIQAGVFLLFEA